MYKCYCYILMLFLCVFSYAASNLDKTSNFNFSNLYNKKSYGVLNYGWYDPSHAIAECNYIPAGDIWPAPREGDPPFPDPKPIQSDCGMSTQVAYGCKKFAPGTDGEILTHSVVGISNAATLKLCTGTIINKEWVLTAAHCVINNDDAAQVSNPADVGIFPWQKLADGSYGIPFKANQVNTKTKAMWVKTIYISKYYSHNKFDYTYSPDLALLRLAIPINNDPNAASLQPIPISNDIGSVWPKGSVMMTAGYGNNEKQEVDGQLRYRKSYYMTDIYNHEWQNEGKTDRYGDIYTLDSLPEMYKTSLSAWSFGGTGDSGGPLLSYNSSTKKFRVEGVNSRGMFCEYAGFFAKLPYPYGIYSSVTFSQNNDLIHSIIRGDVSEKDVYCRGVGCPNRSFNRTFYVIGKDNMYIHPENIKPTKIKNLYATQIVSMPEIEKFFSISYLKRQLTVFQTNSYGELSEILSQAFPDKYGALIDLAAINNLLFILTNNIDGGSSLIKQKVEEDGQLSNFEVFPSSKSKETQIEKASIGGDNYLFFASKIQIKAFLINIEPFKMSLEGSLPVTNGEIIQIKYSVPNQRLFVLTTKGIYVYFVRKIVANELSFHQIAYTEHMPFDEWSNIIPIFDGTGAVTTQYGFRRIDVWKIETSVGELQLKQEISMYYGNPNGLAAKKTSTGDMDLYVTETPRQVNNYIILPDYTTFFNEEMQTAEEPGVVKFLWD